MGAYTEEAPIWPLLCHGSSGPKAAREGRRSRACRCRRGYCCVALAIVLGAVAYGALAWFLVEYFAEPQYSVEIAAVSGLDPATDLHGRAPLDPVFNLTVGIASQSLFIGTCIEPRTAVKVSYSYLGLPLAGGRAPAVCAGPKEWSEKRTVFARGVGVSVPGYMLDSLAEDMRSGEAVFKVELIAGEDGGYRTVAMCLARVGGGGLEAKCR
ncbi:hypothetical protein E2562_005551 [Oryza meyeriana var. granulata]|uniref:Late embryogenesis abundant protein LEA-2 subgroup domain-containing protein n=1 Tax=Oryza meyeriana var. granulata TaxID=110450 RepID=A0A6G1F3U8_9ORYZ|nr:hypothetical protein E2562_005551 [Oryza meyeriana var. granulata]